MIRSFGLAVTFLTRIPIPVRFIPQHQDWGQSVLFFPIVGLIIGVILTGLAVLFSTTAPGLLAVLLLTAWVSITGGLHLDGLADGADAWIGGCGDREKTLHIMKDPRSGPMAVTVVVLVLLGKFAALEIIVAQQNWKTLLTVPVLGRTAILFLLLATPYVRAAGIGVAHAEYLPRTGGILVLAGVAVVTVWLFSWNGLVVLTFLGIALLGLRRLLVVRLGGTTGDTLGAACELTEVGGLVSLALLVS